MEDEWECGERVAYLLHNRQKLTTVRVSQLSAGGVSFWSCYKQAWGFCLCGSCNPKTFPNLDKLQAVLPQPGDFFLPKRKSYAQILIGSWLFLINSDGY